MKLFGRNDAPLTAEGVTELYREHLGREVESPEVLANHLAGHKSVESLRRVILGSPEYQSNNLGRGLWNFLGANLCRAAPQIETDATDEELQACFLRIAAQWSAMGETDAHWSVLTSDKYRTLAFPANAREFYLSGRHTASLIDLFAQRNGVTIDRTHALELGCGTGRITVSLAQTFAAVTAVDISSGHLELCREALASEGQSNVAFTQLTSPKDAAALPPCSFFLSTIVLQHNPPPLAHYLLDQALGKVAVGGAALFQVPTHYPDYRFRLADYLHSPAPDSFEMHCLPMDRIFRLLQKHGFTPLEVIMDTWTGLPGSHTFFAVKDTARAP